MAKYTVTHSCGHEDTHQLFGAHKERDRKIAWLETTDCSACYQAKRDAANAVANAAAAEVAQAKALPALVGSEKQIAWAETIRVSKIENFEKAAASLRDRLADNSRWSRPWSDQAKLEILDAIELLSIELTEKIEARYWIDNRDSLPLTQGRLLEQIISRGLIPTAVAEAKAAKEGSGE